MTQTSYLARDEGRLAYDDRGQGPLVVCVPGMGDVRAQYRFLTPRLLRAGFRVVTVDLRGHGESDATFSDHERTSAGADLVALVQALDAGPAHLIGSSFGAAAAVWAAAEVPELVASATLVGPFVRDVPVPLVQRLGMRVMLARPWAARAWVAWYAKLYPGSKPDDFQAYRQALRRNLAEPGRVDALRAMATATSRDIDPRLDRVEAPSLVIMGTADPDFADPAGEAHAVANRLGGQVVLVEGAGHYPHVQQPDTTAAAITHFLQSLPAPS